MVGGWPLQRTAFHCLAFVPSSCVEMVVKTFADLQETFESATEAIKNQARVELWKSECFDTMYLPVHYRVNL